MSKFVLTAQLQLQAPRNTQQVINQLRGQLQGAVNIPVNVQGAVQATKQINQVNQAAQKATTAGERMGKAFGASIKRFAAFNIATRAVGLLASKLSQAVDESIAFQRELIKISQVTGKTVSQLESLTGTITKLSTTLGVSSTSLLQTSRILAQAGIEANDLDVALSALAKTTLAPTFDNITETAEGAVAILAQFGQGVGALETQLGAINAVAGQFAVESGDLISAVRRTGGVFRQAGGDLNELLGLFTSVRATTRENAESIATGLRTIFTRIQRPQTIEYLKQFGVQLTDLEGRFVGPFEAVRQLSTALAGLEQGDIRFVQIAEELGGFRQIGKVIPLIQQFEVAERARQAAIDGGNSLTEDAATAQQALAVQIEKTREKFLALIRSISETSTFQIMIKSVLGIANAFIKVAEAIKPILPLIAAFAAVKLTRGLGSFVSGIGAGIRGKNQGGQIHAFASGGFVPGTGNRDTVPAMLTPGEFVIRKSSVNKIGAGTLAAMNENKYADGGTVKVKNPEKYAAFVLDSRSGNDIAVEPTAMSSSASKAIGIKLGRIVDPSVSLNAKQFKNVVGTSRSGTKFGTLFKNNSANRAKLEASYIEQNPGKPVNNKTLQEYAGYTKTKPVKGEEDTYQIQGPFPVFGIGSPSSVQSDLKEEFAKGSRAALEVGARSLEPYLSENLSVGNLKFKQDAFNLDDVLEGAAPTIEGYMLEAVIGAVGDLKTGGTKGSGIRADFDFPSVTATSKEKLSNLFDPNDDISKVSKADAKRTRATAADTKSGIVNKIAKDLAKGEFNIIPPVKKASGGGISGSDTVPAMLTPGEFVINKKASQSIGYGNLNRMNKQGVVGYANGGPVGPVQYFQEGTDGTGVKPVKQEQISIKDVFHFVNVEAGEIASTLKEKHAQLEEIGDFEGADALQESLLDLATTVASLTEQLPGGAENFQQKSARTQMQDVRTEASTQIASADKAVQNESLRKSMGMGGGADTPTEDDTNILKQILAAVIASGDQIENSIKTHGVATGGTAATVESPAAEQQVQKLTGQTGLHIKPGSAGEGNEKLEQQIAAKTQEVVNAYNKRIEQIHELNAESDEELISSEQLQSARADFKKKLEEQANQALKSGDTSKIGEGADTEAKKLTKEAKSGSNQGSEAEQVQANLQKLAAATAGVVALSTGAQMAAESLFGAESAITSWVGNFGSAINTVTVGVTSVGGLLQSFGLNLGDVAKKTNDWIKAKLADIAMTKLATKTVQLDTAATGFHSVATKVSTTSIWTSITARAKLIMTIIAETISRYPLIAAGAVVVTATAAVYAFTQAAVDAAKRLKEEAIKEGDIEEVKKQAGIQSEAELQRNYLTGGTAIGGIVGGVIGATAGATAGSVATPAGTIAGGAIGGTKGAAVGSAVGLAVGEVGFKLHQGVSALGETVGLFDSYNDLILENQDGLKEAAKNNLAKVLEDGAKKTKQALDDYDKGLISASEALNASAPAGQAFKQQAKVFQDIKTARAAEIESATFGPIDYFFGDDTELKKKQAEEDKEFQKASSEFIDSQQRATDNLARETILTGGSFQEFRDQMRASNEGLAVAYDLNEEELKNLEKQYEAQQIAIQENIAYLKALNFGLVEVTSKAVAVSSSLDRLVASQETGYNGFDQAASVLEQSLTSAAANMNPKDIQLAQETLADTLRSYGADEAEVRQATESVKALSAAQSFASDALEKAGQKLATKGVGGAKEIQKEFTKNISAELDNLNIGEDTKKKIINGLGDIDFGSKEVQEQIASGNFQSILDQAFGPLGEEIKKQVLPALQERAKQENALINLTRQRIQLEKAANEAKKKAIDIELEAAQAIADFGGRSVTTADKIDAANRQLNIDLGAAGIRAGAGTPRELAAGLQQIQAGFNQIEVSKQTAGAGVARGGAKGAFGGVAGVEADRSEQLAQASQALIEFSRKRINLIKEELDIIKKKNALEKSSLDKLLGGDVAGFFKDQAAAGAAVALRTGNTDLLGSFGASAIGAGFQSLEGQGLSDQQMRRASGAALGSLGITDTRSADILGGTTAQEQALKQEGQQFAQILGAAGQLQADVAEMRVTTKNVIIQAAKATMNEGAPAGMPVTGVTPGFAHGGVVYANRGMFVPRGTDTVPAMLTPGEFVVNRAAVQRGNNMAILQAMNNGQQASGPAMSRGGTVRYYRDGGDVSGGGMGISMEVANKMAGSLNGFVTAVDKLGQMQLSVKLDTTNVNVNFNGTSFLASLSENIKTEVLNEVRRQIPNIQHSGTGGHQLGGGSVMGS